MIIADGIYFGKQTGYSVYIPKFGTNIQSDIGVRGIDEPVKVRIENNRVVEYLEYESTIERLNKMR